MSKPEETSYETTCSPWEKPLAPHAGINSKSFGLPWFELWQQVLMYLNFRCDYQKGKAKCTVSKLKFEILTDIALHKRRIRKGGDKPLQAFWIEKSVIPTYPSPSRQKPTVCFLITEQETYQANRVVALMQAKQCVCVVEVHNPWKKRVFLIRFDWWFHTCSFYVLVTIEKEVMALFQTWSCWPALTAWVCCQDGCRALRLAYKDFDNA